MNKIKNITLGITGSIAAYKAADLCSKLVKDNYNVTVIMTKAAQEFVGVQTFLTLSKNNVITGLWDHQNWKPGHIDLSDRTDLFIVAPATANFIAKYANGIADDALSTYAISHTSQVLIAPAMNPKMWNNPAVKNNIKTITNYGSIIIGPATGEVACGDNGKGRMSDIKEIINAIKQL